MFTDSFVLWCQQMVQMGHTQTELFAGQRGRSKETGSTGKTFNSFTLLEDAVLPCRRMTIGVPEKIDERLRRRAIDQHGHREGELFI
jgi:hypothetical protein